MTRRPVLILASNYPPENIIGALRPARFARYLPQFGYEPVVITASPQREPRPGVVVAPFRSGLFGRLLDRTLFPYDDRITWTRRAVDAAERLIQPAFQPILLSTSPPVSAHWAAYRLKRRHGLPWVADFRDPLVGNFARPRLVPRLVDRFVERRVAHAADRIVVNTPTAADAFRARYPSLSAKVHHLYNGFDPEESVSAAPLPPRDGKLWIHCGSVYLNRYPERLVAALDRW